jgi:hypothetical protein
MRATSVIRHLLEEPDDEPLGMNPLEPYVGPVEFNHDVKAILDHALLLKQQAEQAGALNPAIIGDANSQDVHRALLLIACEDFLDDRWVDRTIKRLKREMHSVWK